MSVNINELEKNEISYSKTTKSEEEKQKTINKLKELLPECFNSDNILDINKLKDYIDITKTTANNQGYELTFAGKGFAKAKTTEETKKELKVELKQSKNFDTTNNIILRGDNLDCLKLLNQSYHNKIKMIYIDPPYNTGNDGDFVYNDDFKSNDDELINKLGLNEETKEYLINIYETRQHSSWLSFMYPRLKIAQELLTDDGIIFISIDDNEMANLKLLCDEIFGKDNFVNCIINITQKSASGPKASAKGKTILKTKDYILVYCKNKNNLVINPLYTKNEDLIHTSHDFIYENGEKTTTVDWFKKNYESEFKKYNLSISKENIVKLLKLDREFYEDAFNKLLDIQYRTSGEYSKQDELKTEDREKLRNGEIIKHNEYLLFSENSGQSKIRILNSLRNSCYMTDDHYREFCKANLMGDVWDNSQGYGNINAEGNFPFFQGGKKPLELLRKCLKICGTKKNDIILDFFAGSGTTAQAVMELNKEDGGNRKFILCQWDEKIAENKEEYKFIVENKLNEKRNNDLSPVISDLTIERVNRAGKKLKKEIEEENKKNQSDLLNNNKNNNTDIGYKVFSLVDKTKIIKNNENFVLNNNRKTFDILYNMMINNSTELTEKIEEIEKNKLYLIKNTYYILDKCDLEKIQNKDKDILIDGYSNSIDLQFILNVKARFSSLEDKKDNKIRVVF